MKRLLPFIISLILILCSCGERTVVKNDFMMDTVITYTIKSPVADKIIDECREICEEHEDIFSAYDEDSAVSRFNRDGELVTVDFVPLEKVLRVCKKLYAETDGAFDITVAPLVKLWSVNHASESWTPPEYAEIAALLPHIGMDKLSFGTATVSRDSDITQIDLGGVAKGYTLGTAASHIQNNYGTASGTVSFGGNIALIGRKSDGTPWNVGIKNPFDTSSIIGTLSLDSGIVAVSGAYERYAMHDGKIYHHIIDPKTGCPAESDLASAAVWVETADSDSGALADALSTALFVMGHDKALEFYNHIKTTGLAELAFEAVLIKNDGSVTVTSGLKERFLTYEK